MRPDGSRRSPGVEMTRLRMAVIGVGHLGQHHARILAGICPTWNSLASPTPTSNRPFDRRTPQYQAVRSRSPASRPGRRGQRRHARRFTTMPWPRPSSSRRAGPGREAGLQHGGRGRRADRPRPSGRAAPGRAHRAVQPGVRGAGPNGRSARSSSRAERHGPFTGRASTSGPSST